MSEKMTRKELIELGLDVEDAIAERERLGDFDPNSPHMLLLLKGVRALTVAALEKKLEKKK
jgi:hypothetical protein